MICYIIPKSLEKTAGEIISDCCYSPRIREELIKLACPVEHVPNGNYLKYEKTEIPVYSYKPGTCTPVTGRQASHFLSVVHVEHEMLWYETAWGPHESPLYNGAILVSQ